MVKVNTFILTKGLSKRSKNRKQQQEAAKPVNYSLFNPKITFELLKAHLWTAADILRGSLDPIRSAKLSSSVLNKLYEKAPGIFEDKVEKHSKRIGVRVKRIAIKNLINRWGSLTNNSVINLNLNLIKAPEDVIDYIILHELCHLKIKEHSHHYWDLLHKYMPNYHDKIEWLKINGSNLLLFRLFSYPPCD